VIDEKTIIGGQGIVVTNLGDNREVPARGKVSHGGTMFSFVPAQPAGQGPTV